MDKALVWILKNVGSVPDPATNSAFFSILVRQSTLVSCYQNCLNRLYCGTILIQESCIKLLKKANVISYTASPSGILLFLLILVSLAVMLNALMRLITSQSF